MKLKDRVAIVTGGGRGIGRAIAEAFSNEGAIVTVTVARGENEIDEVASQVRGTAILADVSNIDDVQRLVSAVISKLGRIDILVNNAARGMKFVSENFMTEPKSFWESDPDSWRNVINTNVNGVYLMTRAVFHTCLNVSTGES